MSETKILKEIQLLISKLGGRLWRNNCGYLQAKDGRWVKFGVSNPGGSDGIGFKPTLITQEMVGKTIAIFLAIEIKKDEGILSTEQIKFIDAVNKSGGIAFVARSTTDVIEKLVDK